MNSSFEVGLGHGWGYKAEGYYRNYAVPSLLNTNHAYHGQTSIRIPAKSSRLISRIIQVKPNRLYTLSAWVRSDSPSGVRLSVYNVATPPPDFPDVQSLSTTIVANAFWQRVSVSGYLLDYPHSDYQVMVVGNPGISFDALQLEEGELRPYASASEVELGFERLAPGNILYEDENPTLQLVIANDGGADFRGPLRYEVFDVFNRLVHSGTMLVAVPAGSRSVQPFHLPAQRGILRVVAWLPEMQKSLEEVVCGVVPRPRRDGFDESSRFGIHPNFAGFQLDILNRLGIKWCRAMSPGSIFRWSKIEPTEGHITWYDDRVNLATNAGMMVLGTLHSGSPWPAWADAGGVPNLDKWESFVERVVAHYRGSVHYWEVWNEPIYVFTTEFYAELLKRAAAAIRRTDPNARIVGMGGVYERDWILEVLNHLGPDWPQYLDIVSTHLYPANTDPSGGETSRRAVAFKEQVMDVFGVDVWNTEAGVWDEGFYKTANSGFSPIGDPIWPHMDSERYVRGCSYEVERMLENLGHCLGNGFQKYFYYDSRIYLDPSYQKSHPTILEYDDTVRAKGIAYAIAAYFLDGSRGLGNVSVDDRTTAYLFDRSGEPVVLLWADDGKSRDIQLGGGVKVYDAMGNMVQSNAVAVQVGRIPRYLTGDGLSVAEMRVLITNAVVSVRADTHAPAVSVDSFPIGSVADGAVSFRWLGIDDISVPHAADPEAVLYSWKLDGHDGTWSPWTPANRVAYSLSPGPYTFRVRARDRAGNVSSDVTRDFSVSPVDGARPTPLLNFR